MTKIEKAEFWAELDATNEAFVRQKYALGNYDSSKKGLVSCWIAERDRMHDAQQRAVQASASRKMVFWTGVTAIATCIGLLAVVLKT